MSLKQLFALRERLWSNPATGFDEIEAQFIAAALGKFIEGNAIVARSPVPSLVERLEALESRLEALEAKH